MVRDYWPAQVVEADKPEPAEGSYVPSVQEMIVATCREHGIEPEIPLAIARLETGNFTSAAFVECNNVGGMSIDEVPIEYASLEEGVSIFVENLARNYFRKGFVTVEEISKKYCPVNANAWAEAVQELMREDETNEKISCKQLRIVQS